jgi:hypothetical protein
MFYVHKVSGFAAETLEEVSNDGGPEMVVEVDDDIKYAGLYTVNGEGVYEFTECISNGKIVFTQPPVISASQ